MKRKTIPVLPLVAIALAFTLAPAATGLARSRMELAPGESNWAAPTAPAAPTSVIVVQDLTSITLQQMVEALTNQGPPLPDPNNDPNGPLWFRALRFKGIATAAGRFDGATDPIGLDHGGILSSGRALSVVGGLTGDTNEKPNTTTTNPGSTDLDLLRLLNPTGKLTTWVLDAAVLTFQVRSNPPDPNDPSTGDRLLVFDYVFGSEEYNEWVYTGHSDGFGIWIDPVPVLDGMRTNYAVIPRSPIVGRPVTVDNVNWGNTSGKSIRAPSNQIWYRPNACGDVTYPPPGATLPPYPCAPPNRETELDGLTQHQNADVAVPDPNNPSAQALPYQTLPFAMAGGVWYEVKIAIADVGDAYYDSDVFVKTYFETGACCSSSAYGPTCRNGMTEAECDALSGTFSQGLQCNEIVCGTSGRCCLKDDCVTEWEEVCLEDAGIYQGDGLTCGAMAACYIPDPNDPNTTIDCVDTTDNCCSATGGTYDPNTPVCHFGGCCASDGTCSLGTEAACTGPDIYQGDRTDCIGDADGNGIDDLCEYKPVSLDMVPTVPHWALIIMPLLLLTAVMLIVSHYRRRRSLVT